MHYFFVENLQSDTVSLDAEDVKHAFRVLRLRTGDAVTLCDGLGTECMARIEHIDKSTAVCSVQMRVPSASEPRVKVTLFQGLPKTGKMETVIQKCVELGVHAIVPMLTERCVVQPKESFSGRIERWQRISLEAAKQSRRGCVPKIQPLERIDTLSLSAFDLVLMAYENEHSLTLKDALNGFCGARLALLIGPEGGFTDEETEFLRVRGVRTVTLGPRILRTETAGMAMLAQVLYEVES